MYYLSEFDLCFKINFSLIGKKILTQSSVCGFICINKRKVSAIEKHKG